MAKPNYTGVYHMVSQDNFEEYLAALGKQPVKPVYFARV